MSLGEMSLEDLSKENKTEGSQSSSALVAVLMTCHNRRDVTLACLEALYQQNVDFAVYLVDDGSTDGTAEAVKNLYPSVEVLQGDGSLFWVGGMRLAFGRALDAKHPYYLWLNDDTLLEPDCIQRLLETHRWLAAQGDREAIVVGSVKDPASGMQTYGGRTRPTRWYSFKFETVEAAEWPQKCDTMQGNVVLIPYAVAVKVGNVDAAFVHNLGDLDYGLRAGQAGCSVWVAPGFAATCSQNSVSGSWVDLDLSVWQRLQKVLHIKGFPMKAWMIYLSRHAGPLWFIYFPLPYIRAVIGYRNLAASPTFAEAVEQEVLDDSGDRK